MHLAPTETLTEVSVVTDPNKLLTNTTTKSMRVQALVKYLAIPNPIHRSTISKVNSAARIIFMTEIMYFVLESWGIICWNS